MRVGFFRSTKDWCVDLAEKFQAGAAEHGDQVDIVGLDCTSFDGWDAACILGIGYISTWDTVQKAPVPMVYLDKGFTRTGDYYYASIGEYRPVGYVSRWNKPIDRRVSFGWEPRPWRSPTVDGHVLIAGSSLKFHEFHRLPPPEEWAYDLFRQCRNFTDRPIRYRPKPNQPLSDMWFTAQNDIIKDERRTLEEDLKNCHVCITHGSSVGLDAMLAGIPSVVLGTGIVQPISSVSLEFIEEPYLAPMWQRIRFLNDLAYCQWTTAEYKAGKAWSIIKPELEKHVERNKAWRRGEPA